jgi:hypothetical protein
VLLDAIVYFTSSEDGGCAGFGIKGSGDGDCECGGSSTDTLGDWGRCVLELDSMSGYLGDLRIIHGPEARCPFYHNNYKEDTKTPRALTPKKA